jgi:hypothetical protein
MRKDATPQPSTPLNPANHYAIAHVATRAAQLDHVIEFCVDTQMGSHRKAAEYLIKRLDPNRLVRFV